MGLEERIAEILQDPILHGLDFELEGARISAERLRAVGQAILDRRIKIETDKTGPLLSAVYTPHFNRMTLGAKTIDTPTGKSGVVHESTHALVDLFQCKDLSELSDEVGAYLTEAMYLRAIGAWLKGGPAEMAIYEKADALVKKKNGLKRGVKLKPADYQALRDAIHAHPAYSSIDDKAKVSGLGVP